MMDSEAEQKRGKTKKSFWYPTKIKHGVGQMAQTPRAGTGDSMGQFRRCRCSTLLNYNSYLSICGTFLEKMLPPPDNRGLLPTPTKTDNVNLSAITLNNGSFRTPTAIFGTDELYNPGLRIIAKLNSIVFPNN